MNAPLDPELRAHLERALSEVTLDDKYALERGRAFMSGTQALVHNGPGEGEIHGKWPTPCISSQAQAVQWAPGAIGTPAPSSQWWDRF